MRRGQGGGGLAPVCFRLAAQGASTVMALDSRTPISELKRRVQRFYPRRLLRGPGMNAFVPRSQVVAGSDFKKMLPKKVGEDP